MGFPKRMLFYAAALCAAVILSSVAQAADPKRNLAVAKTTPAATETRVALVIGNSSYKDSPLANPVNDATDIAKALQQAGFKVILKRNAGVRDMRQAIREFGTELRRAQVGLFYFAGHGIQVKGNNYLVPVGADIASEADTEDLAIDANYALRTMEEAQVKVSIVILDACRNNPYARSFRSSARGLAQMNAATGSVIAYATAPGSVAADGAGRNGVYTKHLLASLAQSNTDILKVFQRTRAEVVKETGGKQTPWESISLVGDFYFKPGTAAPAAPVRVQTPEEVEQEGWNNVKSSRDKRDLEDYLKQYPKGRFAPLASQKLKALALAPAPPKPETVASIAPVQATKPKPEPAAAGKSWTDPATGMEFVWIPKGCFQMGSPTSESGRGDSERLHEVCVDGFWMAKYEVTNSQYKKFRADHGADDKLPVTAVSWQDAMRFAEWLSDKTGKKLRLPTEAEWEYAARAGTSSAYFWGDSWDGRHNYVSVSDSKKPIGSHQPNAWGLHDMLGNVSEWTASSYDSGYGGAERQVASLEAGGNNRALRGGSWNHPPRFVRAAFRDWNSPDFRGYLLGFRLARIP